MRILNVYCVRVLKKRGNDVLVSSRVQSSRVESVKLAFTNLIIIFLRFVVVVMC